MEAISFFFDLSPRPWFVINALTQLTFLTIATKVGLSHGKIGIGVVFLVFDLLISILWFVNYEPDIPKTFGTLTLEFFAVVCAYGLMFFAAVVPLLLAQLRGWPTWVSVCGSTFSGTIGVLYWPMALLLFGCGFTGDCL